MKKLLGFRVAPIGEISIKESAGANIDRSDRPWRDVGLSRKTWKVYEQFCQQAEESDADCPSVQVWKSLSVEQRNEWSEYFDYRNKELDEHGRPPLEFGKWLRKFRRGGKTLGSK